MTTIRRGSSYRQTARERGEEGRGFAVSLEGAGARPPGVARCDQPRALDVAARGGRKLESVPAGVMAEVLGRVGVIVG